MLESRQRDLLARARNKGKRIAALPVHLEQGIGVDLQLITPTGTPYRRMPLITDLRERMRFANHAQAALWVRNVLEVELSGMQETRET